MNPSNSNIQWFNLSRFLLLKFFVAVIILALIISFTFSEISKRHLIDDSEKYAITLAIYLQDEIYEHFFFPKGITLDSFDWTNPHHLEALDSIAIPFLKNLNVMKINIFNNEKQIVYSTNHELIGIITSNNAKLIRALQGENLSSLELARDKPDIEHDIHDVDLLETYTPFRQSHFVFSNNKQVFGAFEIYQDITTLYNQITTIRNIVFVSSFSLMGIFFLILYVIIKRADKIQRSIKHKVQRYTEQLEEEVANRTSELTEKTNRLQ